MFSLVILLIALYQLPIVLSFLLSSNYLWFTNSLSLNFRFSVVRLTVVIHCLSAELNHKDTLLIPSLERSLQDLSTASGIIEFGWKLIEKLFLKVLHCHCVVQTQQHNKQRFRQRYLRIDQVSDYKVQLYLKANFIYFNFVACSINFQQADPKISFSKGTQVPLSIHLYSQFSNLKNKTFLFPQKVSRVDPKFSKIVISTIQKTVKFEAYPRSGFRDISFGKFVVVAHCPCSLKFLLLYYCYCTSGTKRNFRKLPVHKVLTRQFLAILCRAFLS